MNTQPTRPPCLMQVNAPSRDADPQRRRFWGFRTRLIVSFCLVFGIALAVVQAAGVFGVPFTRYAGRLVQAKADAFHGLNLIADIKKERLRRWLEGGRDDIHRAATNALVEDKVGQLLIAIARLSASGMEKSLVWKRVRDQAPYRSLETYINNVRSAFARIQIAAAETGTILFSTYAADLGTTIQRKSYFTGVLETGGDYIGAVKRNPHAQTPSIHFSHVIKDSNGEVVSVFVMEIDVDDIIKPILRAGQGLGTQGEAVLVNQEGVTLTSLKHPLKNGTKVKPLEYRIQSKPAMLAVRGEEGIIEARDYRGEQVLAAYRHIRLTPGRGWGLVVKRDKRELFSPWRQEVTYTIVIALIGLLVISGVVALMVRGLTRPILNLSRTAKAVAAGNFNARSPVTAMDEVGVLASTFNDMIERLHGWQKELQEQVITRTRELKEKNADLNRGISERKRAEEELVRHRDHLEELVEERTAELQTAHQALLRKERLAALGQLIATVSHELRNPLGTLRASLYHITDKLQGKKLGIKRALSRMERSISRCDNIIDEMLDFSRIRDLDLKSIPIDTWLAEVLAEQTMPEGIMLKLDLLAAVEVEVDGERLRRAVINVFDNACQALLELPDQVQRDRVVNIGTKVIDRRLEIAVDDTGPGIPDATLLHIFEPLYSTKGFGVGLGLPIVKQIMAQHGGGVEISSEAGQGTQVVLWLPLFTKRRIG